MIKKFAGFDKTTAYSNNAAEQLPRGGYVCQILKAEVVDGKYGQSVKVYFDIAEGDHADYYKRRYDANENSDKKWGGVYILNVPKDDGSEQDGWTKRKFKTFTNALEDSNPGYHFDWDDTKFRNKKIGLVFNYREYNFAGRTGMTPNPAYAVSVNDARAENFKIPADRMLKHIAAESGSDFTQIEDDTKMPWDVK